MMRSSLRIATKRSIVEAGAGVDDDVHAVDPISAAGAPPQADGNRNIMRMSNNSSSSSPSPRKMKKVNDFLQRRTSTTGSLARGVGHEDDVSKEDYQEQEYEQEMDSSNDNAPVEANDEKGLLLLAGDDKDDNNEAALVLAAENNNESGCKKKPPVEEAQVNMNENLTAANDDEVAEKNEEALTPVDDDKKKLVYKKNENDDVEQCEEEEEKKAPASERSRRSLRSKMATQFFLDYRQANKKRPGNAKEEANNEPSSSELGNEDEDLSVVAASTEEQPKMPKSASELPYPILSPPNNYAATPEATSFDPSSAAVLVTTPAKDEGISQLNSNNDVLCGKGSWAHPTPGNVKFNALIQEYAPVFASLNKVNQSNLICGIVNIVKVRGGRFLIKKDATKGGSDEGEAELYQEIRLEKAESKVKVALRRELETLKKKKHKGAAKKILQMETKRTSSSRKEASRLQQQAVKSNDEDESKDQQSEEEEDGMISSSSFRGSKKPRAKSSAPSPKQGHHCGRPASGGAWSAKEDWELVKQVHTHGTSWAIILNESSILSKRYAGVSSVVNARQSLKQRWRNQFMNADIFGEESESDIYSEDDDENEGTFKRRKQKQCKIQGCVRNLISQEVCYSHGAPRKSGPCKTEPCDVRGCTLALGKCFKHGDNAGIDNRWGKRRRPRGGGVKDDDDEEEEWSDSDSEEQEEEDDESSEWESVLEDEQSQSSASEEEPPARKHRGCPPKAMLKKSHYGYEEELESDASMQEDDRKPAAVAVVARPALCRGRPPINSAGQRLCKVESCPNRGVAFGVCYAHGAMRTSGPYKTEPCHVNGCNLAYGRCYQHGDISGLDLRKLMTRKKKAGLKGGDDDVSNSEVKVSRDWESKPDEVLSSSTARRGNRRGEKKEVISQATVGSEFDEPEDEQKPLPVKWRGRPRKSTKSEHEFSMKRRGSLPIRKQPAMAARKTEIESEYSESEQEHGRRSRRRRSVRPREADGTEQPKPKRRRARANPGEKIRRRNGRRLCATEGCDKFALLPNPVCMRHGAVQIKKKCRVENCKNISIIGGICVRHGAQVKRCKHPGCNSHVMNNGLCKKHGAIPRYCSVQGCPNIHIQGGLCKRHGAKTKQYFCEVEGCTSLAAKKHRCYKHALPGTLTKRKKCKIEGCTNYRVNKGLCGRHGAPRRMCNAEGCTNLAHRHGVCIGHGAKTLNAPTAPLGKMAPRRAGPPKTPGNKYTRTENDGRYKPDSINNHSTRVQRSSKRQKTSHSDSSDDDSSSDYDHPIYNNHGATKQPTHEVLTWVRTMSKSEQRKHVAQGLMVKVRFEDNLWYGGTIARVMNGKSQVAINFDDGTHEVSDFPDTDIVPIGAAFIPRKLKSSGEDEPGEDSGIDDRKVGPVSGEDDPPDYGMSRICQPCEEPIVASQVTSSPVLTLKQPAAPVMTGKSVGSKKESTSATAGSSSAATAARISLSSSSIAVGKSDSKCNHNEIVLNDTDEEEELGAQIYRSSQTAKAFAQQKDDDREAVQQSSVSAISGAPLPKTFKREVSR